jgi:hypothetical protein
MTFSTDAEKPASERFFLVRITARKYLGGGGSLGSNQYLFNITPGLNISSVVVNGVIEPVWSYIDDELIVTSTTDLSNLANVMTVDHDIYVTGTKIRQTLSVAGIPDAEWLPLITNYPTFSQSMRDIAEGVFSLSGTDIELICTDRWGQNLLGQYDSLSSAPVQVWVCIDDVAVNRKIFDGEISNVSYQYGKLNLTVIDTFQKLKNTASFGSRAQSHIYTGNSGQYPKPEDENAILPLAIGKSSPFSVSPGYRHVDAFDGPSKLYHLNSGLRCKLIGPQNPAQTDTTTWAAGRIVGSDIKRINFGSFVGNTLVKVCKKGIENVYSIQPTGSTKYEDTDSLLFYVYNSILFCQLSNINDFNGEIGDYIPAAYLPAGFNTGAGGVICGYGSGLNGSYNLAIHVLDDNDPTTPSPSDYTVAALSLPNNVIPSMSVWVEASTTSDYRFDAFLNSIGLLFYKTKYTFTTRYIPFTLSLGSAYTVGGQSVRNVYFTTPANAQINISSSNLKTRFSPGQAMTHGSALKFICKSSGLETNDATFTQADTDLAANVSMTVPLGLDSDAFGSYLDASQGITSSTLGILRINQSRQVEYELLKNPNSLTVDSQKSSVNMLLGDTSTGVEYQDIYTTVEFENEQLKNLAALSGTGPNAAVDFPINRQLHRASKTKTVKHVLDSIQGRKDAIAGYFSNPTVEYTLATASEDLASSIGDVVEITNTAIADSVEAAVGIVVGLDQTGQKTQVKINEVRGVS